MKKIIALLLCVLTIFSLCACDMTNGVTKDPTVPAEDPSSKKQEPKEVGTLARDMNVEFYNKDDIVITATAFYKEDDGDWVLECDISNTSKDDVFVALEYPEINGICSPIPLWADAKKGTVTDAYLFIYTDFLELTGITTITEIAAHFNIYNENYRPISEEYISFTNGAKDYKQEIDTEGQAIIDEENVQVIVQNKRIGKEGLEIVVWYINNNDYTVSFDITDVSIDGEDFAVEAPFELPEYTIAKTVFCVYDSDMIYAGIDIETVDKMTVSAKVIDVIGDTVAECEAVEVTF